MVVLTRLGPPEDGIRHTQADTDVYMNERLLGNKGKLFISEARISWVGPIQGQLFSLEYPHVAMHAVKRADPNLESSAVNRDCLYLVLDVRLVDSEDTGTPSSTPGASDNDSDGGGDLDDEGGITEIRFFPADPTCLQSMFDAMTACQALHPDPADISSDDGQGDEEGDEDEGADDDDDEEGMYDDADEEEQGVTGGNGDGKQVGTTNNGSGDQEEPMDEDGAAN